MVVYIYLLSPSPVLRFLVHFLSGSGCMSGFVCSVMQSFFIGLQGITESYGIVFHINLIKLPCSLDIKKLSRREQFTRTTYNLFNKIPITACFKSKRRKLIPAVIDLRNIQKPRLLLS